MHLHDMVRISWSPPQLEDGLETSNSFVVNLIGTRISEPEHVHC